MRLADATKRENLRSPEIFLNKVNSSPKKRLTQMGNLNLNKGSDLKLGMSKFRSAQKSPIKHLAHLQNPQMRRSKKPLISVGSLNSPDQKPSLPIEKALKQAISLNKMDLDQEDDILDYEYDEEASITKLTREHNFNHMDASPQATPKQTQRDLDILSDSDPENFDKFEELNNIQRKISIPLNLKKRLQGSKVESENFARLKTERLSLTTKKIKIPTKSKLHHYF